MKILPSLSRLLQRTPPNSEPHSQSRGEAVTSADTWLLVGLGNLGSQYANTRHNVGFMVADELARRARASFSSARSMRALTATTVIGNAGIGVVPGAHLILAKPTTFMNESGQAVAALTRFHKINPDHLIVIHDELDLDLGQMRVKVGGGDNGHNGLRSIRSHLGNGDYYRVRFGIGRPPGRMDVIDWVLHPFAARDKDEVDIMIQTLADACESLMTSGLAATQNRFNS